MARRSGQKGYIERKGNWWHVRFRIDTPGQEKRKYASVPICPTNGAGKLTKPERERKAKAIIAASGAASEEHFRKVEAINLGATFRTQAEWWLSHVQTRRRKPAKAKTVDSWRACLNKWLLPNLGGLPLASVNNLAMKELVSKMAAARLAPKSIQNYTQVVKMVMASAINEEGDEIYPRKWNHEFIDLPVVGDQRTPTFTSEQIGAIVAVAEGRYQMLYALLAGTGMRIGEALGLEIDKHIDAAMIKVRQSVWKGRVYSPKTSNAIRDIDLHLDLSAMLKTYIGDWKAGFLFHTRTGHPVEQTEALKDLHSILQTLGLGKCGLHSFRRFRTTVLRKNQVPEDLVRYWIGHAEKSVTDRYSKLKDDLEFRKQVCAKVGLGFALPPKNQVVNPDVAPNAPKTSDAALAVI
jgi:integrase